MRLHRLLRYYWGNKEEEKEEGRACNLQSMMGSSLCYQEAAVWGFPLPEEMNMGWESGKLSYQYSAAKIIKAKFFPRNVSGKIQTMTNY